MASTSAASDPSATYVARYFDGVSPTARHVQASAVEDGLLIRWADGETLWPWREIERRDAGPGEARLALRSADGARITLSASDWDALRPRGGKARQRDDRVSLRREAKIGGALLVAAAAIFFVMAYAIPNGAAWVSRWTPPEVEARMGEAVAAQVEMMLPPCDGEAAERGNVVMTQLAERLAKPSGSRFPIRVSIVHADFPNAFALPGGRVMVTSDLIASADHPDEVAGVLSHEIAHVAKRHVVKGMVRSATIGALTDIIVGGGSGAAAPMATAVVNGSALRYDRADESEADALGVTYLEAEGLDPGALARFFDRLNVEKAKEKGKPGLDVPEILSTHPDSRKRAALLRKHAHPGAPPSLSDEDWAVVKQACGAAPPKRKWLEEN